MLALPRFPMGGPYATLKGFREKVAMRPLPVKVLEPDSPVVGKNNPPRMLVQIEAGRADLKRLNCFVQGQGRGRITADPDVEGRYVVKAKAPLDTRRSKYTLTAPGNDGTWYWYSHLWVRLDNAGERTP
ncbi:MAG: hypothetical protein GWN87_31790 [Desulfuromonadales bacterium]|nr:hypothetical protein [Desulfuromonadales bacterium]